MTSVQKIWEIAESVVESMDYEFVGAEFARHGGRNTLRVFIDTQRGITLEDCEAVSHQLSGVLDVEDPIREVYDLEVSSPGLDRPLFKAGDFVRFAGEQVKIRMAVPMALAQGPRRNFSGTLLGMEQGKVRLAVDDEVYELVFEQIERARLVPRI